MGTYILKAVSTFIRHSTKLRPSIPAFQCLLFFIVFLFSTNSTGQAVNQFKIISYYLYNFPQNINWPDTKNADVFKIAVYRPPNLGVFNELSELSKSATIQKKPIQVSIIKSVKEIPYFQMVYIDQSNDVLIENIYETLNGKPVLLVTQDYNNKQLVMINITSSKDNRFTFEVNNANLLNHGMTPSPELILNGGSEIDVANLFREGQASLITMRKQLEKREQKLTILANDIQLQEQQIVALLNRQEMLSNTIKEQTAVISSGNKEINTLQTEVTTKTQDLKQKKRELIDHQKRIDFIQSDIESKEKRLFDLNQQLSSQSETISELDALVLAQQKSLK